MKQARRITKIYADVDPDIWLVYVYRDADWLSHLQWRRGDGRLLHSQCRVQTAYYFIASPL